MDLHQFGYQKPDKFQAEAQYATLQNPIIFVDNETLAVSLFVRNPNPGISVHDKVLGGQNLFQTVLIAGRSGKVLRTQTWSNGAIGCGLFPGNNGTFIIEHGLELSLHGPDGTLLKSLSLDPKDFPRSVVLQQSPSGETLFAVRTDQQGYHILRIRTSNLEPLGWLDFSGYFSIAGSDSYIAAIRALPRGFPSGIDWGTPPMQLFVHSIEPPANRSTEDRAVFTTSAPGCNSVDFLDNQTIALTGVCHEATFIDVLGRILYQRHFKDELTGRIQVCRSCDLVAFRTYVLRGGSSFLDTFPRARGRKIVLVDRRTFQSVEIPDANSAHHIALSPDGCHLATQGDSQVEMYGICGTSIERKLHAASGAPF